MMTRKFQWTFWTCKFQWKVSKGYKDQHGGCSSGVRSKEIERIREF